MGEKGPDYAPESSGGGGAASVIVNARTGQTYPTIKAAVDAAQQGILASYATLTTEGQAVLRAMGNIRLTAILAGAAGNNFKWRIQASGANQALSSTFSGSGTSLSPYIYTTITGTQADQSSNNAIKAFINADTTASSGNSAVLNTLVVCTGVWDDTAYPTYAMPVTFLAGGLDANGLEPDVIEVGPGTYDERNIARDGVNIFGPMATLTYSGASGAGIVDDTSAGRSGPIRCKIVCKEMKYTGTIDVSIDSGCIVMANYNSDITFSGKLRAVPSGSSNASAIRQSDGNIILAAVPQIYSTAAINIWWTGGNLSGYVPSMVCDEGGYLFYVTTGGSGLGEYTSGDLSITTEIASATDGTQPILFASVPAARVWFTFKEVQAFVTAGDPFSVTDDAVITASGHVYLTGDKINPASLSGASLVLTGTVTSDPRTTDSIWAKIKKIGASASSNNPAIDCNGGEHWIEAQNGEDTNTLATNFVYNHGGTLHLKKMDIKTGTGCNALRHASGTTIAMNCTFDTTASTTKNPVTISEDGATFLSCQFSANGTRNWCAKTANKTVTVGNCTKTGTTGAAQSGTTVTVATAVVT